MIMMQNSLEFKTPPSTVYTEEFLAQLPPVDFSLATATPADIELTLFTSLSSEGVALNIETVKTTPIDKTLPTKIFFHGYTTNTSSPWYITLKTAYLEKGPHNIIYVDWSKAGDLAFQVSAANVDPIGEFLADFLIASELPPENIHLIGHSLGTHVTAFIGKHLLRKSGKKIGRITGLDPAGPAFEKLVPQQRLCEDDALFIDVVHTDIGYYGYTEPLGHVDFYPNGGKNQPGCPPREIDDNFSHAKATHFFIESITNTTAKAKKALLQPQNQIVLADQPFEDAVVFGDAAPTSARGIYHLETNPDPPYLKQ